MTDPQKTSVYLMKALMKSVAETQRTSISQEPPAYAGQVV